jgi:hypothetical protein
MNRYIDAGFWFGRAALIQSIYYILTGFWAQAGIESFMAVTGPKTDIWLVKTVGVLIIVIGITLLIARIRKHYNYEIVLMAMGVALGLAIIDIHYVFIGRISPIYLLDAVVGLALLGMWITGLVHMYAARRQIAG